jgi:hypothetical protein
VIGVKRAFADQLLAFALELDPPAANDLDQVVGPLHPLDLGFLDEHRSSPEKPVKCFFTFLFWLLTVVTDTSLM